MAQKPSPRAGHRMVAGFFAPRYGKEVLQRKKAERTRSREMNEVNKYVLCLRWRTVATMSQERRDTILLVDDDPAVRNFLRIKLEAEKFECVEVADGETALEKIEDISPDLILLDYRLGDGKMDGLDVCEKLRERGVRVPVILLTVVDPADDPRIIREGLGLLGATDYVLKRGELRNPNLPSQRLQQSSTEMFADKSNLSELMVRIKARLAEARGPQNPLNFTYDDGYLRIDLPGRRVEIVTSDGWRSANLTPSEFSLLDVLLSTPDKPVKTDTLLKTLGLETKDRYSIHAL